MPGLQLSQWPGYKVAFSFVVPQYRWTAMIVQIASTTPKGQAPERKPYVLDMPHPIEKASTKIDPCRSSAYMAIMKVSEMIP